ncbi:MAG: hypothetical protein ACREJM_01380 [Candidatus Saccharimonadales bacterium]
MAAIASDHGSGASQRRTFPEAVDLAFGAYVSYGTILKQYRNARIIYTPSDMISTKRTARRGMDKRQARTICTSHVERLNGNPTAFLEAAEPANLLLLEKAGQP